MKEIPQFLVNMELDLRITLVVLAPLGATLVTESHGVSICFDGGQLSINKHHGWGWCCHSRGRLLVRPRWERQRQHRLGDKFVGRRLINLGRRARRRYRGHLLLHQCHRNSSIQAFGFGNKNNCFELRPESINESHSIEEWIGGSRIGLELINEFGETLDIIGDSRGLFNLKELAYEGLILVTIKTIMEILTESGPCSDGRCVIDGLIQASGVALQIHGSHADPHRRIKCVHVEAFLAIRTPEAGIFTIEFVEGKFRKTTGWMMVKVVWGRSLEHRGMEWWMRWNCERRWGMIMKGRRRRRQGGGNR